MYAVNHLANKKEILSRRWTKKNLTNHRT